MEISISVRALLSEKYQFVIPLYQRSYTWTETEIVQLLRDVHDVRDVKDKAENGVEYHIGTLTVDIRKDNLWEVIDGQQRLTTLTLIHAVACHLRNDSSKVEPRLSFDAREDIRGFITDLYNRYPQAKLSSSEDPGLSAIRAAVLTIEQFLNALGDDRESYLSYFYDHVHIIVVDVPAGTDINHYFEVMNNRGEQLEQHEVLKARLLGIIKNKPFYKQYALVWDACSQMDKPVQAAFDKKNREMLFGTDYAAEAPPVDIGSLVVEGNNNEENDRSLMHILTGRELKSVKDEMWTDSRYKSIIDFPNFLLQVLKVTDNEGNKRIPLDDKHLLEAFSPYADENAVIAFLENLLRYRILFDKYVLKRVEANDDWSWKLIKPVKYQPNNKEEAVLDFRSTFRDKDDDEDTESKDFIMIQSMLHVAAPGNNYKNWLFKVLKFFRDKEGILSRHEYLLQLKKIAREDVAEIVGKTFVNQTDNKFHQGTNAPRVLFYYLDYLLWDLYDKKASHPLQERIERCRQAFFNFRFTQNNSVEHVTPQTPMEGQASSLQLDSFGNLCLISSSTNSRLINLHFEGKRDIFRDHKRKESLKQAIIFSYEKWGDVEIEDHGGEMLQLIEDNLNRND